MHELGIFLRRRGREPKFVIREQIAGSKTVQHVRLPPETVKAMILQRVFQMPLVSIKISERMSVTELSLDADADSIYPISGFPRSIFGDEIKYPCEYSCASKCALLIACSIPSLGLL
jgi:hypothetical protein